MTQAPMIEQSYEGIDEVARFVQWMFSSLPRSDQRRWAEVYLRGLLFCEGKKSVRNIAHTILRLPVAQSLQQFINQSPWDWGPVRGKITRHVVDHLQPQVLVAEPVIIPKSGSHSVGVTRRFLPAVGKTVNCQIGIALFMVSQRMAIPVNWRVVLSGRWGHDEFLRARTYIPPHEAPLEEWRYILDTVAELSQEWGVPGIPLVVDAVHMAEPERLITALQQYGFPFVVKVSGSFEVGESRYLASVPSPGVRPGRAEPRTPLPAHQYVEGILARREPAMSWLGRQSVTHRNPLFFSVPARIGRVAPSPDAASLSGGTYQLVTYMPQHSEGADYWITNAPRHKVAHAASLTGMSARVQEDMQILGADFGLQDFEGRSFRGWHHHMTLVSAAYAFAQSQASACLPSERFF